MEREHHYLESVVQYHYRIREDPARIEDGDGKPVLGVGGQVRSDHRFIIENAGLMLALLLAVHCHPDGYAIPASLKAEADALAEKAFNAGIDTIGVMECA